MKKMRMPNENEIIKNFEKNNKKVDKIRKSKKFYYLAFIAIILTIVRYSLESFCYIYEYHYSNQNKSEYLKAYSELKLNKECFFFYQNYLHNNLFETLFDGLKNAILFFIHEPFINIVEKADLSIRMINFIDLIMQLSLNFRTFDLNYKNLNLFDEFTCFYLMFSIIITIYYL